MMKILEVFFYCKTNLLRSNRETFLSHTLMALPRTNQKSLRFRFDRSRLQANVLLRANVVEC